MPKNSIQKPLINKKDNRTRIMLWEKHKESIKSAIKQGGGQGLGGKKTPYLNK